MASIKDVEQVADDLTNLVDQLRKELRDNASFDKLVQLADQISEHAGNGDSQQSQDGEGSVLSSVLSGGWDAAREALLPAAEDAAGAAGEYVAQHGPEILRDRIVPRFVESFNEASGGS